METTHPTTLPLPKHKYTMELSLNVLNHLGFGLYSNIPAVLSEAVANAYDADAENVRVTVGDGMIVIEDDGSGMTLKDINEKFLMVGYRKRKRDSSITPIHERAVMGRKGIGKLSLFSIADVIKVFTVKNGERNGFLLSREKIEEEIEGTGVYHPEDIPCDGFTSLKGTRIEITKLKKKVTSATDFFIRRRLARRFSVIGPAYKFEVFVNEVPITIADRDYLSKLQFLWKIGPYELESATLVNIKKIRTLGGEVDRENDYYISGWIGAVEVPGQLKDVDTEASNNKISIICRGKVAQEDILETYGDARIYSTYLIGEIRADFLDTDDKDDIATSSRQSFFQEDPRYQKLVLHVRRLLSEIAKVWSEDRKEISAAMSFAEFPVLEEWYQTLRTPAQVHARSLFSTIQSLHFEGPEAKEQKRELYKQGIMAFERLKLRDNLQALDRLSTDADIRFASIFSDFDDIEASLYYDIATERVRIIRELANLSDAHAKEKVLQKHIFDHLWLLHPSWERPTGDFRIEQSVTREFASINAGLTEEERRGRIDIKYRTAAGKHVIIELKKYERVVTMTELLDQVRKYRTALRKCLKVMNRENESIETICILGQPPSDEAEYDDNPLKTLEARIIYYDHLIEDSLRSYGDYLQTQQEVTKIRRIIDRL